MLNVFRKISRYLPLALGITILAVAAPLVPWHQVGPYLRKLTPLSIGLLLATSAVYYLGRIVRYWLIQRLLGRPAAFRRVALACLVAQPVAVLPGGELYRSTMLKRYADVPLSNGAPSVFAQSAAESAGLLVIALLGAATIHRYLGLVVGLVVVFVALWAILHMQNTRTSHRLLVKLPWVNVSRARFRSFMDKNQQLLGGRNVAWLFLASCITTGAGILTVFITARTLHAQLDLGQAAVTYALPMMLESVSFLPGGLGINEQSSIVLLRVFGVQLPLAVAITIILRLVTLGMGFVYGFAAMGWAKLTHARRFD